MPQNEITYLLTMKLFKKMFENELISAEEYDEINTKMQAKYRPKIGDLFCEKARKTVDFTHK